MELFTQTPPQEFLFRLFSPEEEPSLRRCVKFRAFKHGAKHRLPFSVVAEHLLPLAVRCGFTGPNAVLDFARSYDPKWGPQDLYAECIVRTIGLVSKDGRFKPGVRYEYRPKKHLRRGKGKPEPEPTSSQVQLSLLPLEPK